MEEKVKYKALITGTNNWIIGFPRSIYGNGIDSIENENGIEYIAIDTLTELKYKTMKREIKYRVFDPAQKKFINPANYFFNADFSEKVFSGELELSNKSNSNDCIIMQFTGLFDKNGKEIYEGDLLGDWNEVDGEMIMGKIPVVWSEEDATFMLDYSYDKDGSYLFQIKFVHKEMEVVGNIYEN